jgi:hypothetical protein
MIIMDNHLRVLLVLCVGLLFTAFSCEKESDKVIYKTDDLKGVWKGDIKTEFFGGENDGLFIIESTTFTFAQQGIFFSMNPGPDYTSRNGNLSVEMTGQIKGTITTTHESEYGAETTSMNWTGCSFRSKSEITVNMNWSWINESPSSGYYEITGTLKRVSY